MKYLIDSNIFIKAHRDTHPLDIHVSFWEGLKKVLAREDIFSIDKVKHELWYFEDDLKNWCHNNIEDDFWKDSSISYQEYSEIQNWASSKKYNQNALADFADLKNADPFLASFAYFQKRNDSSYTIVTHEISRPESIKSVKLPDVCIAFEIPYITINQLFRNLQISF